MNIIMQNSTTAVISGVSDFDLAHTFECGQCFRWTREDDLSFVGVAYGKAVKMCLDKDTLTIYNTCLSDVENIWLDYLDLKRDYKEIKKLYENDKYLAEAIKFGHGIHILNQDIFECLISFIISSQNQIPRIKKIVHKLCLMYGKKINLDGKDLYTFPTLDDMKNASLKDLEALRAGYRASYIIDAIEKLSSGEVCLEKIKNMPYQEAKKALMKIKGVGPKVADCVLLFSAGKTESFPIDVWVERTMRSLYLDEKATKKMIEEESARLFGKYAGFAQQYLFYYARENGGFAK